MQLNVNNTPNISVDICILAIAANASHLIKGAKLLYFNVNNQREKCWHLTEHVFSAYVIPQTFLCLLMKVGNLLLFFIVL